MTPVPAIMLDRTTDLTPADDRYRCDHPVESWKEGAMLRNIMTYLAGATVFILFSSSLFAASAQSGTLLAQRDSGGETGVLKAAAFDQVPPGLSIKVLPYNDDDLNMQIKSDFEEQVRRQNRSISVDAALLLSFDTEIVKGSITQERSSIVRGEHSTDKGTRAEVNIWSSSQDSVLGGRKPREKRVVRNVLHINVVLRDLRSGKVLWQGDTYAEIGVHDELRLAKSMVEPLILNLGRTVRSEPFDIR